MDCQFVAVFLRIDADLCEIAESLVEELGKRTLSKVLNVTGSYDLRAQAQTETQRLRFKSLTLNNFGNLGSNQLIIMRCL